MHISMAETVFQNEVSEHDYSTNLLDFGRELRRARQLLSRRCTENRYGR